jgi:hypothetical protein
MTVFLPETAQVVYQHALYLSVFCRHEEAMQAMNFAVKILDWFPEGENNFLSAKGPVIFYGRGGGRRESIMQPEKIITPPFSKQNFQLPHRWNAGKKFYPTQTYFVATSKFQT